MDLEPRGPQTLPGPVLRSQRTAQVSGLSRRLLLRRALAGGLGLLTLEAVAGTLAFAWSAAGRTGTRVRVGTFEEFLATQRGLPILDGFPGYVAPARAFVMLVDPDRGPWLPGADLTGDGTALNVRALSQICPHLGCRPNPCVEDFYFRCPCHQSRYDRLGIKPAGERYGPASRGMDRFAVEVDDEGVLTIDPTVITLGPLPIALGQPGLIPPRVENGCT